jgi:hypothetical protein
MKNRKSFRVSLPGELFSKLKAESDATGLTFSSLGRMALIAYFNAKKRGQNGNITN